MTEYLYALIDKDTEERVTSSGYKKRNTTGFYNSRVGPAQLLVGLDKSKYEIVKYKVTLERVND